MKNLLYTNQATFRHRAGILLSACVLLWPAGLFAQHYQQTNLVRDTVAEGNNPPDPNLKNPWGVARSTTGAWWVADNRSGVATLYSGAGAKVPLTVTIPHTPQSAIGTPTGVVFNGSTTDFDITPGNPALFIFAALDGTISAWNGGTAAIEKVQGSPDSVLTGATIAQVKNDRFLFVADLKEGIIKVYNTNFTPVEIGGEAFNDHDIPRGFAPFNVQNIGGNLYVTYAKQNEAKNFVVPGTGLGFVDIYATDGRLLLRLEHNNQLNAPWGLTVAPSDFGTFSHQIIVGQFGSGEFLAFDAVTGKFVGSLTDTNNNPIVVDGLWGISIGAGQPSPQTSGPGNSLFFAAGLNAGSNGLFGTLTPIAADLIQGSGQ